LFTDFSDIISALNIPQPNASASKKKSGGSKAWIAGAVVGPILGLALICALVWFLLRRRKNKRPTAQQGSAAMATTNPTHPPAGVGGYTDAKPQFPQQQQPGVGQDLYANQGAYTANRGYSDGPVSPAPQYNPGAAPYNAPVSPPPQQAYYGNDVKNGYTAVPHNGASELGGESNRVSSAHATTHQPTAELGGESRGSGAGLLGPSELPTTQPTTKPT
jgi:LPXTG-motif cell wall-anchored protein